MAFCNFFVVIIDMLKSVHEKCYEFEICTLRWKRISATYRNNRRSPIEEKPERNWCSMPVNFWISKGFSIEKCIYFHTNPKNTKVRNRIEFLKLSSNLQQQRAAPIYHPAHVPKPNKKSNRMKKSKINPERRPLSVYGQRDRAIVLRPTAANFFSANDGDETMVIVDSHLRPASCGSAVSFNHSATTLRRPLLAFQEASIQWKTTVDCPIAIYLTPRKIAFHRTV